MKRNEDKCTMQHSWDNENIIKNKIFEKISTSDCNWIIRRNDKSVGWNYHRFRTREDKKHCEGELRSKIVRFLKLYEKNVVIFHYNLRKSSKGTLKHGWASKWNVCQKQSNCLLQNIILYMCPHVNSWIFLQSYFSTIKNLAVRKKLVQKLLN